MKQLNIGLIGHKFMGKAHSHAYRDVNMFFPLQHRLVMHTLCGVEDDLPEIAERYGWMRAEKDWRRVVDDPEIGVIDICTPDSTHCEIAVAAAEAGKHVICEKPLALTAAEARRMLDAARAAGVHTLCNFTYRGVPALRLAKQLLDSGRLGRIYSFKAQYLQDFALSPDFPFVWRMDSAVAGAGILADKGSHVIDMARFLVGEIGEVCASTRILQSERTVAATGERRRVDSPDEAAFLASFSSGAMGVFELSNMAAGRKNAMLIEVNASQGSLRFDLERLNELDVYFASDDKAEQGFRTINVTEDAHPLVGHWWPSGHALGWEHTFVHQIHSFVSAMETDGPDECGFEQGLLCQRVVDAVARSDRAHGWVEVEVEGC